MSGQGNGLSVAPGQGQPLNIQQADPRANGIRSLGAPQLQNPMAARNPYAQQQFRGTPNFQAQPIDRIGSNGVFTPRTGGMEPMPNQMPPTIGPNGQPISNAGAGFGNGLQPSYNPGQMGPGSDRIGSSGNAGYSPTQPMMTRNGMIGANGMPVFGRNGMQPGVGVQGNDQLWNGQRLDSMPMGQMPGPMVPQTGLLGQMPGRARYPWQGPAEDYQNGGPDMGGGSGGY
jgi:hypothetical protein